MRWEFQTVVVDQTFWPGVTWGVFCATAPAVLHASTRVYSCRQYDVQPPMYCPVFLTRRIHIHRRFCDPAPAGGRQRLPARGRAATPHHQSLFSSCFQAEKAPAGGRRRLPAQAHAATPPPDCRAASAGLPPTRLHTNHSVHHVAKTIRCYLVCRQLTYIRRIANLATDASARQRCSSASGQLQRTRHCVVGSTGHFCHAEALPCKSAAQFVRWQFACACRGRRVAMALHQTLRNRHRLFWTCIVSAVHFCTLPRRGTWRGGHQQAVLLVGPLGDGCRCRRRRGWPAHQSRTISH